MLPILEARKSVSNTSRIHRPRAGSKLSSGYLVLSQGCSIQFNTKPNFFQFGYLWMALEVISEKALVPLSES